MASLSSRITLLLAARSSRSIRAAARITSGIRSGPRTTRATARISSISKGFKAGWRRIDLAIYCPEWSSEKRATAGQIIIIADRGVNDAEDRVGD